MYKGILAVITALAIVVGVHFATLRTEIKTNITRTPCNAIITTYYYKTDIFGYTELIDFKVEKLNPYGY